MARPVWQKALGRLRGLGPLELLDLAARHGRARLRAQLAELCAARLALRGEATQGLPQVVAGRPHSWAEAVAVIEAGAGQLPVTAARLPAALEALRNEFPDAVAALVDQAERACAGQWRLLGFPATQVGRTPDWQCDFVSGQRWDAHLPSTRQPIVRGDGSDIKVPWELSRLQHLPAVALAFRLTGEPRYQALIVEQLEDWIAHNPPGLGVNWRGPMEVALRAVAIAWAFELCRRASPLPVAFRARVYFSLYAHGQFLRGHLEDGGSTVGNHHLANLLGLCWLGSLYPALRGAVGWRQLATARLARQLRTQLRADGSDAEGSTGYHRLVAELVGLSAAILEANQHPAPAFRTALGAMARFSAALQQPNGLVPQIGDQDGGRAFALLPRAPQDHRALISWAAVATDSPALAAAAPFTPEALLLLGAQAGAAHRALVARAAPEPQLTALRGAGLTVLRAGDLQLCLNASSVGQHGQGGHGHNDKLALELYLAGPLIADPGSFTYTRDPQARNRFRSVSAHATAQVDGREQNPLGPDLFFLPERAHACVRQVSFVGGAFRWEGEHRGFGPLRHRREVTVAPAERTLTLTDAITDISGSEAPTPHLLTLRFPLAPDVAVSRTGDLLLFERRDLPTVRLEASGESRPVVHIDRGAYAPDYGAQVSVAVVRLEARGPLPLTIRTTLRWD